MEDPKRIIPSIAIAFLVLVLMLPPRTVTAGELPRLTPITPQQEEELFRFLTERVWDMHDFLTDLLTGQGQQGSKPGDGSNGGGHTESFTFGATRVDLVFGCGRDGSDSVRDFGLGKGPLSLASHLGRFSYYLAPNDDSSSGDTKSFVLFGNAATPQTKRTRATPLLGSYDYPNAYLVGLTGIRFDGKDLPGIQRETFSGGVVLSIAVPATFLAQSAYKLLEHELVSRIGPPTVRSTTLGLNVCYESLDTVKIPSMALVFDYGNAVMQLEVGNYFYMDARTGVECLTIVPSPDAVRDVSLLGSLIQAGTHMIYDIRGSTLTFESLSSGPPPHILPLLVLFANFLLVAYMIM